MPQTPDTGAAPYCDAPVFLAFYDARKVADLLSDGGSAVAAPDLVDPATAGGARLATLLRAASGDVETACAVGGRYKAADLAALAAGNGGALLAGLVASLAFGLAVRRRGLPVEPYPEVVEARDLLERLRSGDAALPFAEAEDAGLPAVRNYTPAEALALGRPSDLASRLFGRRSGAPGAGLGCGRWGW